MSGRCSFVGLVLVLTAVLIVPGLKPFQAEPQAQNPDTLAALLVEVKGLRAAMEQMAATGPRVQLAFGRLQLHEQRISGLVRRLDVVRERIGPAMREEETLRARLNMFQGSLKGGHLPEDERKEVEAQIAAARRAASRAAYDLQQLQTEESNLGNEIAAEQNRWVQINQQLEDLERALVRR